jgi:hypothetical protein
MGHDINNKPYDNLDFLFVFRLYSIDLLAKFFLIVTGWKWEKKEWHGMSTAWQVVNILLMSLYQKSHKLWETESGPYCNV